MRNCRHTGGHPNTIPFTVKECLRWDTTDCRIR